MIGAVKHSRNGLVWRGWAGYNPAENADWEACDILSAGFAAIYKQHYPHNMTQTLLILPPPISVLERLCVACVYYFPMQNEEKISPSKSSAPNVPVISPSW